MTREFKMQLADGGPLAVISLDAPLEKWNITPCWRPGQPKLLEIACEQFEKPICIRADIKTCFGDDSESHPQLAFSLRKSCLKANDKWNLRLDGFFALLPRTVARHELKVLLTEEEFTWKEDSFSGKLRALALKRIKVGDKIFAVSPEFLSLQSRFFETLFYGTFVEGGHDTVELKEVDAAHFQLLLNSMLDRKFKFTVDSARCVLSIAHRYLVDSVVERAVAFLLNASLKQVSTEMKKQLLILADQCDKPLLHDYVLTSFRDPWLVLELAKSVYLGGADSGQRVIDRARHLYEKKVNWLEDENDRLRDELDSSSSSDSDESMEED